MSRILRITPIILFLISTSSWANGFYLGAGVGPETANFRQAANVLTPGSSNVKDTTNYSGTGIFGSIFGGYSWSQKTFYLAGEMNANLSSVQFVSSNQEFMHSSFSHTTYNLQHSFGLSLLPGFLYTQATLFYIRLGYANGNFRISTTDTSLARVHRNLDGFRYGLGVNHSFTKHLAARMEYSSINYSNTPFTVLDGTTTKTTKISPSTSQVEFGLIYNFC